MQNLRTAVSGFSEMTSLPFHPWRRQSWWRLVSPWQPGTASGASGSAWHPWSHTKEVDCMSQRWFCLSLLFLITLTVTGRLKDTEIKPLSNITKEAKDLLVGELVWSSWRVPLTEWFQNHWSILLVPECQTALWKWGRHRPRCPCSRSVQRYDSQTCKEQQHTHSSTSFLKTLIII